MFRVFTVLVVLGAAIGAWWWWLPPERAPHPRGEAATADPTSATPADESADLDAEEALDGFSDQASEEDLLSLVEVVDRSGHPVSGAKIEVFKLRYDATGSRLLGTGITDRFGLARFDLRGAHKVRARRVGYSVVAVKARGSTSRITLDPALVLRGRAMAFGAPATGAKIQVWDKDRGRALIDRPQIADADGNFTVTGIRNLHPFIVVATFANCAPIVMEIPNPRELLLVFGEGLTLSGVVLDELGAPVDPEMVIAPANAPSTFGSDTIRPQQHEAMPRPRCKSGKFTVRGLQPGAYDIHTRVSSTVNKTRVELLDDSHVVIRIARAATLTVEVVGPDDQPVQRDRVSVYQNEDRENSRSDEAITLKPGRYVIAANGDGLLGVQKTIDLSAGETRQMKMKLRRGVSISGRVLEESGEPVVLAWVNVQQKVRGAPSWSQETRTRKDGSWLVKGLAPGPCRIQVASEAHYREVQEVSASEGAAFDVQVKRLGKIVGRFSPAPEDPELRAEFDHVNGSNQAHVLAQTNGSFEINDPAVRGKLTLTLTPDGGMPVVFRDLELERGATHDLGEIALVKGVPLQLTVLDDSESPLEGALVEILRPWYVPGLRTDDTGLIEVENQPRRLTVRVAADDHAPVYRTIDATKPVTVRLTRGIIVRGSVRDPAGDLAANANVVFWRQNADGTTSELDSWKARVNGLAEFNVRLRPGKYRVRVYGKHRQLLPETYSFTSDAQIELKMR